MMKQEPKMVGETPPHSLDGAFQTPTVKGFNEGLLNNQHFQKAVKAAVEAFEGVTRRPKNVMGASASHAARQAFLDAIR